MLLHLRDAERRIGVILHRGAEAALARRSWHGASRWLRKWNCRRTALASTSLAGCHHCHIDHTADEALGHLLERSGVLREPVRGRVDFVHRTFQRVPGSERSDRAGPSGNTYRASPLGHVVGNNVMACGHAKHHQAGTLLAGILDRSEEDPRHARHLRLLAAACLETVSNADPDVIARVEAVRREQPVPPRSLRETRSLSSIGHRVLRYLPRDLSEFTEAVAAASVRAAALTAGPEALKLLRIYAQDSREAVQAQLVQAWQYFDPEQFAIEALADSPLINGEGNSRQ